MVSFRNAFQEDDQAIADLHAKSWQENYRGTFSDTFLDDAVFDDRLTVWKDRLANPNEDQWVYVAEVKNSLVAFICAYLDKDPTYGTLIDNLHVHSRCIGQRIGERLMVEVAKLLRANGKQSMYLWVLTSNTKAIRFYRRLGGVPMETVHDFDIGDREIVKTRYYWQSLDTIVDLPQKTET